MMMKNLFTARPLAAMLMLCAPLPAAAAYPDKPVRWVVP